MAFFIAYLRFTKLDKKDERTHEEILNIISYELTTKFEVNAISNEIYCLIMDKPFDNNINLPTRDKIHEMKNKYYCFFKMIKKGVTENNLQVNKSIDDIHFTLGKAIRCYVKEK